MHNETPTEAQIAAVSTAPRVTPADVEANIISEHYFAASEGCLGEWQYRNDTQVGAAPMDPVPAALHLLTFCVLVLRNGFTVTGQSACASPENFNADIGRRIAREDAVRQVWPLMGYALKEKLHQGPGTQPGSHASAVLYPAIGDAMKELDAGAPRGMSQAVDRAYDHLHRAFWSECPAPASAAPLRTEGVFAAAGG